MRWTSKCSRTLPRPYHSSQETIYTPTFPQNSSLLVPPFTSYRTSPFFSVFYSFYFLTMPMGDRENRGPSPLRPPTTPFRIESLISPIDSEYHPVIHAGRVAVITGAASGIGRAAAQELARCTSLHRSFFFFFSFP